MIYRRLFPALLVGLAIFFALASCGRHKDASRNIATHYRTEIPLADIASDQGCLSLPKLFQGLRDVQPGRAAGSVPVSITFDSAYAIRDDFRRVIAYGQLVVYRQPLAELLSLPDVAQEGCTSVSVTGTDGLDKSFTVKTSTKDSLMAESEDGERIDYTWLSPTSILSRHRYPVLDQPCTTGEKPVLVTVGKVIEWGDHGVPAAVPANGSVFSIEPQFISLASAAVGDSPDSVYDTTADGSKAINLGRLNEMTAKPPRPEVLSCGGAVEPDPQPPGPRHDDGNPDPNNHS
jgi:hypothetical protein